MFKILKPQKRSFDFVDFSGFRQQKRLVDTMNRIRRSTTISMELKFLGYGIKVSGIHLLGLLAIFVYGAFVLSEAVNPALIVTIPYILVIILAGVIGLVAFKLILDLISFIADIPNLLYISKK